MEKYFIYKITNVSNGKIYIGMTGGTVEDRFKEHIKTSKNNTKIYLYRAMRKYGTNNFFVEKIDETDSLENALTLESKYIYELKSYNHDIGYNLLLYGPYPIHNREIDTKRAMAKIQTHLIRNERTSSFLGVSIVFRKGVKYRTSIRIDKKLYQKIFLLEKDAAKYYDLLVISFKLNRPLNFPQNRAEYDKININEILPKKNKMISKYKGVTFWKLRSRWQSFFTPTATQKINIGTYLTEEEAALSYDKICFFIRNDRKQLNFPEKIDTFSKQELESFYTTVMNKKIKKKSKYRGVFLSHSKWAAQIWYQNKTSNLGRFETEEEAALAYNKEAINLFGNKAKINIL